MQKRVFIAVLLMSAVILVTNYLFPPPKPQPRAAGARDSVAAAPAPAPASAVAAPVLPAPGAAKAPARQVVVSSPLYRYTLSTRGGALVGAEMLKYASYQETGRPVQLVPRGAADFLSHRLVVGRDTLDLRGLPFQASAAGLDLRPGGAPQKLRFTYGGPAGVGVEVEYTFRPDDYLIDVRGRVTGVPAGTQLLTGLGPGLETRDSPADVAVVGLQAGDVERLTVSDIEAPTTMEGPLPWVGVKDKYFLAALVAGEESPFRSLAVRPLPPERVAQRDGDEVRTLEYPRADAVAALPLAADGAFAYRAYLGPQEHRRMAAVGFGLEEVTPYGYAWLRPVVRPIAGAALWVLEYMHTRLGISYGWALILFGVMVKLVLWPLNAKAMRAQMKNMAVQPLMQEIQTKYKEDPQRQQQEMIKLYKEHGFNPLAGCLPLLIPMPVFITLFFVFQNAIVFRGTGFWWMSDLSQKDPYYIIPLLFVGSTFLLQVISMRMSGMETNPQMKMMMYVMPVMMGVFFFNFASGLNLYYTASNLAGIPQQILIARERRRAQDELNAKKAAEEKAAAPPRKPGGSGGSSGARRVKRRS
ncbi:MAG TPA: membrane protein insertase YidC [Longimicrobiaceae bacterium]